MTEYYGSSHQRNMACLEFSCLVILFLLISWLGLVDKVAAEAVPAEEKTLQRRFDPVVVKGEYVGPIQGMPLASLRLFVFRQGRFHAIPFQVDERNPEGEFVFPSGLEATRDVDQGLMDYNDELVFMVQDAGGRAPTGAAVIPGTDRWIEIELSDPLDLAQKAWVYFCYFSEGLPACSTIDYVHYHPDKERIFSDHYGIGYRKGMSLYTDLYYPDGKGGFGPDLMDRIKVRIQVKFIFNVVRINKTEEDFRAEVVAWKDGPVRVLRNVQNYVRVLFNLPSPSVFAMTEYYSNYMYTPLRLTVTFDPKWVFNKFGISGWHWYFYGDMPGLSGGSMYSNKNLQGVPISNEHSRAWYEKNVDTRYLVWGYATKENAGTWFCNLVIPDAIFQFTEFYFNFDEVKAHPPEDLPGEVAGGVMMNWENLDRSLWDMVRPGTYELGLETFFPPGGFQPEGVQEWRNIREFPLQVKMQRCLPACPEVSLQAEDTEIDHDLAKKGTAIILTDIHEKSAVLYDVLLHFGSMQATGLDRAVGQEINTREWLSIPLREIKVIEHRIEPKEPVTGVERPLVARITTKDGNVRDLIACKCCNLSGSRVDGKRVQYLLSTLKRLDFVEP